MEYTIKIVTLRKANADELDMYKSPIQPSYDAILDHFKIAMERVRKYGFHTVECQFIVTIDHV